MNNRYGSNTRQLAWLLTRQPRVPVEELCRHTDVLPDRSAIHTFMPWIDIVRQLRGDVLARAMLTHAVVHGGLHGCRNTYAVAFWREPRVRQLFDRAQLLQLCRKWATAHPYEVLSNYRNLALALGRYASPELDEKTDEGKQALMEAGSADATQIVAVAARNLGDSLRDDHLALLLHSALPAATLLKAALRAKHSSPVSLILQGYTLAHPGLRRKDGETLANHVLQRLRELQDEDPNWTACAYRWLLEGSTRATTSHQYQQIRGFTVLRAGLEQMGWQFLTAEVFFGQTTRTGVTARNQGRTIRLAHLASYREELVQAGDEVLVHPAQWVRYGPLHPLHPCRPPSAAAKEYSDKYGGLAF